MTIIQVRYTVRAAYAAQNQEYIRQAVKDIQALQRTDLTYSVFLEDDGKTFVHEFCCANEEARAAFGELESFQVYLSALQESDLEVSPVFTNLTLVASSPDLL